MPFDWYKIKYQIGRLNIKYIQVDKQQETSLHYWQDVSLGGTGKSSLNLKNKYQKHNKND